MDERFDQWFARHHPWDWFTKELGEPVPTAVRLKVWDLCRAAWHHETPGELPLCSSDSTDDQPEPETSSVSE